MTPQPFGALDSTARLNPLVLTTGRFSPGEAARFCAAQTDDIHRRIGEAELLYYRGDIAAASHQFADLSDLEDFSGSVASLLCRGNRAAPLRRSGAARRRPGRRRTRRLRRAKSGPWSGPAG